MILRNFMREIPKQEHMEERRKGKWTIHENACHLAQAEKMINARFKKFKEEGKPNFQPYLPGTTTVQNLLDLDLEEQLLLFASTRNETVDLLKEFDESTWGKDAIHPEYRKYNARILARHTLMHDHFHMYRIEELWLTKTEFL